jgi:hypothetical protein
LGPDFGRGGGLIVDGLKLDDATEDLRWACDWNADSELLTAVDLALAPGAHRIEVFGFEDCCAGQMSLEFQTDNGGWQEVGAPNLMAVDQDQDGLPDCSDSCPNSEQSTTVVIARCDTGVPNLLVTPGCTIADRIAECASGAANHGRLVSCVAHLTMQLKAQNFISGKQKGAIDSCAAKANLP